MHHLKDSSDGLVLQLRDQIKLACDDLLSNTKGIAKLNPVYAVDARADNSALQSIEQNIKFSLLGVKGLFAFISYISSKESD